jgi:hypothetical protein
MASEAGGATVDAEAREVTADQREPEGTAAAVLTGDPSRERSSSPP